MGLRACYGNSAWSILDGRLLFIVHSRYISRKSFQALEFNISAKTRMPRSCGESIIDSSGQAVATDHAEITASIPAYSCLSRA
jgi:hypothetical protein